MGTYNIYVRKKGQKRYKPVGSFDWFTHEKPLESAKIYLAKNRTEHPDMEYQIKDADGKVVEI